MIDRAAIGAETALVFDIQRFSVHDGPGIRTTVFLKGCPLRCQWCSNPESQDFFPNLMVNEMNCRRCGACREVCPEAAITFSQVEGRKIYWERCSQCLLCTKACVYDALNVCGRMMHLGEVVEEVERDEAFYRRSGGGVTISGGEPLSQSGFVCLLAEACKARGFHTALDTSGFASWEKMKEVLPRVDLLLYDIKHLDSDLHERETGVSNQLILENLARAAAETRIWLRVPLLSGFNDAPGHIEDIADLARRFGIERISLLPYHEGGVSKCERLGRPYGLTKAKAPGEDHVRSLVGIIEGRGVSASVGR